MGKASIITGVAVILGLALVIQLIPYGRNHTNPPVTMEPAWDSKTTRDLTVRACFDCHSNMTVWPWYSNIAPISWMIQRDVDEGRRELNFSEWDRPQEKGEDVAESLDEGEMPPAYYTLMQSKARLSPAETQSLVNGLQETFGQGFQQTTPLNPNPPGSITGATWSQTPN